jgi:hypothetical protein
VVTFPRGSVAVSTSPNLLYVYEVVTVVCHRYEIVYTAVDGKTRMAGYLLEKVGRGERI